MNKNIVYLLVLILALGITIAQLGLVGVAAISAPISAPISSPDPSSTPEPTSTPEPSSSPTPTASPSSAPSGGTGSSGSSGGSALSPAGGGGSAPSCNDQKPGSAPKLLSAVSRRPNQVTLTWSKAVDPVSYYLVAYGFDAKANHFGNPNVGGPQSTNYTVLGLSGNVTYFFKVRAGNGCTPGDYSNVLSVKANGKSIGKPAIGFEPGVLSAQKAKPAATPKASATPKPTSSGVVSQINVFNRIFNFFGSIFNR